MHRVLHSGVAGMLSTLFGVDFELSWFDGNLFSVVTSILSSTTHERALILRYLPWSDGFSRHSGAVRLVDLRQSSQLSVITATIHITMMPQILEHV